MNNDGLKRISKGPELLLDLVHHSADVLQKMAGLPPGAAQDVAIAIAMRMAELWGGHEIYVPKGTWNGRGPICFHLEERDWQIYHEYDGTNRQEVCTKHRIGPARLYQIIATCRQKIADRHRLTPLPKPSVSGG